jgi:hypothetical protein
MAMLDGRWKVRRESGLLPPFGVRKQIHGDRGWTLLGPLPVAPFAVKEDQRLLYKLLPVRDELERRADGVYFGRAYFLGLRFCTFRMEPLQSRVTARSTASRRRSSRRKVSGHSAR